MNNHFYYDFDGNPISVEDWGQRMQDYPSRILASTELPDNQMLVTLWHGFVLGELPSTRLFGTALLGAEGVLDELETYDSKAEAAKGHARHLAALQSP